uniref:Imm43 family immunity protein n=1 Tax=Lysinibacillus sp. fls2-241-R2A-57 TaxID=3040292 RepID=UPI00255633E2
MHTEFFEKDPFEARDSDAGEWRTTRNIKTELPEELWFVSKDIKYDFDLRWDRDGFFLSSEFLKLLLKFGVANFQYTKLHMVNRHKKSLTSKEYYYVRFYERLEDVIDMEKSNIEFYKQDGRIKKIWDLQLKESNTLPDVFLINNTNLSTTVAKILTEFSVFCFYLFRIKTKTLKQRVVNIHFFTISFGEGDRSVKTFMESLFLRFFESKYV